jgi:hypothetical protein
MARKSPARVKAGKKLAKASKYCKGKTGRVYSDCRTEYFKKAKKG